jgi:hypothetical protein
LRRASKKGTLRAFRNADRFTTFENLSPAGRSSMTYRSRSIGAIGFLPQETAFQVRETLSAFVGGNDEPVSIVAMHSNIAFDFVELKLDGVLHDG